MKRKKNFKPILFISHVHEDAKIAIALKQWLDKKLAKSLNVFVSSDKKESMPGGSSWWDEIRTNLSNSNLLIAIITQRSKDRSWIYFEVGGAYFQKIRVLPLLIGVSRTEITSALSQITYYDISNDEDYKSFCHQILKEFDLKTELSDFESLKEIHSINKKIISLKPTKKDKNDIEKKSKKEITPFTKSEEKEFNYFINMFSIDIILDVLLEEEDSDYLVSEIIKSYQYSIPLIDLLNEWFRSYTDKYVIKVGKEGLSRNDILFSLLSNVLEKELNRNQYIISGIKVMNLPTLELIGSKLVVDSYGYGDSISFTKKMFRFYYWLNYKSLIKTKTEFKFIRKIDHKKKKKS